MMWKLALAQFINTGVLLTMVNAQLYDLAAALPGTLGTGAFDDFVPQWYQIVGVGICVQVLSTSLLSSCMPLVMAQVRRFQLRREKRRLQYGTQAAYDDLCALPEFDLGLRLAQNLNIIMCVLLYGSGMPLLYVVGAMHCLVSFYCDKAALLWYSKRPPAYNKDLVRLAAWYLLPGVVLHCLFALWMFGQPGVFPSDSLIGDADARLAALGFRPQAVAPNSATHAI